MSRRFWLWSCRSIYRGVLSICLVELRQELGSEIEECFATLAEETWRERGLPALLVLTARGILDLMTTAVRERRSARRRVSKGRAMAGWLQDLRFGLRGIAKRRGSSAVVIVTIGLGLGTLVAVFDVVYRTLWRPLPFYEPERLVALFETDAEGASSRGSVAPANFLEWRESSESFERMAAFNHTSMNLTGEGEPERIVAYSTSASLFEVLHVEAALGRAFLPDEDRAGAARVAVLTDALWRRRFGALREVLGKQILLDDVPYEVVGVLPREFLFPSRDAEIYVPHAMSVEEASTRRSHYLEVVARLKDGVSLSVARDEMLGLGRRIAEAHPETNAGETIGLIGLQEELVAGMRRPLFLLLGAMAGVLSIACVNVTNLLLARGTARRREMSIRAALGASRARLIAELLTEALMLSVIGAALALGVSVWVGHAFTVWMPPHLAAQSSTTTGTSAAFALAASIVLGLGFGMVPALELSMDRMRPCVLGGNQRGAPSDRSPIGIRKILVLGEVSLAVVLLAVSVLLLQTFYRMSRVSPGFGSEQVLTMRVELSRTKYEEHPRRVAFYRDILERIERLPGVVSAGFVTMLPLTFQGGSSSFELEARPEPADLELVGVLRSVTPDYYRAMGIPILTGRGFDRRDSVDSRRTVVINESFARRFFTEIDPIGESIRIWGEPHEIIGIVGDVQELDRRRGPVPAFYVSAFQRSFGFFDPRDLAVRATVDPARLARSIRAEIWAIDPDQPISMVRKLDDILDASLSTERLRTVVFSIFGTAALLLAAMGIYGVLSFAVARRTGEIGLRMALGATGRDVLRLVLVQGMGPAVAGMALGLGASLVVTRLFEGMLYGVRANDPWTLGGITVVLGIVALSACLVPSLRATRVDPLEALRED